MKLYLDYKLITTQKYMNSSRETFSLIK